MALPLPRSSAGVPRNTTSPAHASRTAASAIAAPTPEAAIVLWPQPCPSPGSASYSARTAIRGPVRAEAAGEPAPDRRLEAAGRALDREAVRGDGRATHADAWRSSNAGSGLAWIRWDRSRISSQAASIAAAARALTSANGSAGRAARSGSVMLDTP